MEQTPPVRCIHPSIDRREGLGTPRAWFVCEKMLPPYIPTRMGWRAEFRMVMEWAIVGHIFVGIPTWENQCCWKGDARDDRRRHGSRTYCNTSTLTESTMERGQSQSDENRVEICDKTKSSDARE